MTVLQNEMTTDLDLFEARKIAALTHSGKYEIEFLEGYFDAGDLVCSIFAGIKLGRELEREVTK